VYKSLRQGRCAWCHAIFHICQFCDRGHIYCQQKCSNLGRIRSVRRARKRHQATPEGKKDHAERQRRYRWRRKKSVTDQGSNALAPSSTVPTAVSLTLSNQDTGEIAGKESSNASNSGFLQASSPKNPPLSKAACCCICGHCSIFVRFDWLPRHHRRPKNAKKSARWSK
jgi:hypothetical protein